MKLCLIFSLVVGVAIAQDFTWPGPVVKSREVVVVTIPKHLYLVEFELDGSSLISVPATNPPGVLHYSAAISVFEVVDGHQVAIGYPFSGQYTGGKCFEDVPEDLVLWALVQGHDEMAVGASEVGKALLAAKAAREFEAQPLYRQSGAVLAVTGKGARDLDQVLVDGKVVWTRPGYVEKKDFSLNAGSATNSYMVLDGTSSIGGCYEFRDNVLVDVPCAKEKK